LEVNSEEFSCLYRMGPGDQSICRNYTWYSWSPFSGGNSGRTAKKLKRSPGVMP